MELRRRTYRSIPSRLNHHHQLSRRSQAYAYIQVTPDPEAKPATVTPDFIAPFSEKQGAPSAPSPPSASVCEAYRELIEQGLARGRNGKAIWQDLVSDHGFAGGYQAVKRFVRTLRGPQRPEGAGIILTWLCLAFIPLLLE